MVREANLKGVTRWLGLGDRLDPLMLMEIDNYRTLLGQILSDKIGRITADSGELDTMKLQVAEDLLDTIKEYERILAENPSGRDR
jgi:hypothetical protein